MLILSLDTTTRAGSAAVLRDADTLALVDGDATRTHGERLPGELESVLRLAGVSLGDVDLLTVACGPGAFTGLRIGLAAMQGLAMVTGRPVVGVSALDALAVAAFERLGVDEARVAAWMDAARGEIFAALYDLVARAGEVPSLTPLTDPDVGTPDAVLARWRALGGTPAGPDVFIGDGADRYAGFVGDAPRVAVPALAPFVGRVGRRLAGLGDHPPHALQPLYVRRPDAERGRQP